MDPCSTEASYRGECYAPVVFLIIQARRPKEPYGDLCDRALSLMANTP
jgi:hypothetical protein